LVLKNLLSYQNRLAFVGVFGSVRIAVFFVFNLPKQNPKIEKTIGKRQE
jgi:hypothetical protein